MMNLKENGDNMRLNKKQILSLHVGDVVKFVGDSGELKKEIAVIEIIPDDDGKPHNKYWMFAKEYGGSDDDELDLDMTTLSKDGTFQGLYVTGTFHLETIKRKRK
jgi:hypothetical protein